MQAFKNFLSNENCEMTGANTISAAEEILRHNKVSLLILSINEEGNLAYPAIKQMRREHPNLPVIAVSAYTELQYREDFNELDFDAFVPKPIDIYLLRRSVYALLEEQSNRD